MIDHTAEGIATLIRKLAGKILAQFMIDHTAEGIATLIRKLAKFGEPADVQIGIERPNGRLVDVLLEAGHPVIPVSPNAIKTWRESEVISGAKSDTGDALVIAEYLRLRHHRLRPVAPYSAQTKALRTVVRTRDDIVGMRVTATNQLSALLEDHWPGAKAIFADVESPISLAFLRHYPTAAAAAHVGEKRLAAFLTKHGYSGRRPAAVLLTRLRQAPRGTTDPVLTTAVHDTVLALVTVLEAPRGAPGRRDLHVAAKVGSDQRRPGARRVGRLPRSLPTDPTP
ncbi:IS110 family transposase [Mycobacterium sherrisii]|uniref:IS110 family transposase n=1 Tax=Mycobacterium sherrisii TaxID=243061 RepID=UPI003FD7CBAD